MWKGNQTMKSKVIVSVIVIILLLVAGLVYMNQSKENSLTPTETPSSTSTPTPAPTKTPIPTETPESASTTSNESTDTSGKVEVSPGVYNDGTTRELTSEEVANMTIEEQRVYAEARGKEAGFQSYGDIPQISEEDTQDAIDSFNPDNPYIQDIIDSGVLDN